MTENDITPSSRTTSSRPSLRVVRGEGHSTTDVKRQGRTARFSALWEAAEAEAEEREFWMENLAPLVSEIQLRYELAKLGDDDSLEHLKRVFYYEVLG